MDDAGGLRIGDWNIDVRGNEIARDGVVVRLEPKAIEVLAFLAGHAGSVISREEILSAVWPKVVVGDDTLTQAIIKLRKALGDDAQSPRYIETIPKRGYRLIATVMTSAPARGTVPIRPDALAPGGAAAIACVVAGLAMSLLGWLAATGIEENGWPIAAQSGGLPRGKAPPVIAVLPLVNLGNDSRRDYFSEGMTEDIINGLGRFSALRVMSRGAVEPYRAKLPAPRTVRQDLGAEYILKGSVREAQGRLRVSVALSAARQGRVVWSDRYEGEGKDVFEFQDRIVTNIVGVLALQVTQAERERGAGRPVESLEAYDLVLQARQLVYRLDRETNRQARELLRRAIELAPEYGEAYVALAHAEYRRADQGWTDDAQEGMRRVEAHARKALSLPDRGAHARAYAQLARIHGRDLDVALEDANHAVELNPSDPVALYALGSIQLWMGRTEEAVATLEAARRFDPSLDDIVLPMGYYLLGRYKRALEDADARLARNPNVVFLLAVRAATLARLGETADASDAILRLRRVAPFTRADAYGGRFRNPAHAQALKDGLVLAGL